MKKIIAIFLFIIVITSVAFAQSNSILKTIQVFPYQKIKESTQALTNMQDWNKKSWKNFFVLLEDSNTKVKATYALHAYVNHIALTNQKNEFATLLKTQIKKTNNNYAKIALQDELNLLTDTSITNRRTQSLPAILTPIVLNVPVENPVQALLHLQDQMSLAKNPIEQKRILVKASNIPGFSSFSFASSFLEIPDVQSEAALIVTRLALNDTSINGPFVRSVLEKALPLIHGVDSAILTNKLMAHLESMPYDSSFEPVVLSAEEKKEDFVSLFDGTHLNQWMGNKAGYIIREGAIEVVPNNGSGGNLYTKEEFANFIYRFEFQLTPGANNGIGIHAPPTGDAAYYGMEIQILDNESPIYKNLQPYQYHGSVYGIIPAKRGYLLPIGKWNTEEIMVKGPNIKVTLNGVVITEGNIAEASKNGTMDHKLHPGLSRTTGHIGLLGHGDIVRFKNIRVKKLF
jgi:hypothetical protein